MVKSRRVFTREFKVAAVKELESGKPLGYVAGSPEQHVGLVGVSRNALRAACRAQPSKCRARPESAESAAEEIAQILPLRR